MLRPHPHTHYIIFFSPHYIHTCTHTQSTLYSHQHAHTIHTPHSHKCTHTPHSHILKMALHKSTSNDNAKHQHLDEGTFWHSESQDNTDENMALKIHLHYKNYMDTYVWLWVFASLCLVQLIIIANDSFEVSLAWFIKCINYIFFMHN